MSTQKAIQIQGPGDARLVTNAPVPKLRDDYVLTRVKAVALNPTDWKHIDGQAKSGVIVGCDYAGIVEEVGKNVTDFKKGDRIAGVAHGANANNTEDGCFAEIAATKAAVALKIPENISFEEAATLGIGLTTVAQGLYQSLGLAWPTKPLSTKEPILIYGGSTATGTLAIQYAKLSGYEVIATASPHNHEFLKSLGAEHVIDYKAPDAGAQIRKLTNDKLKLVFDCIAEGNAPAICADAISSSGGVYSNLLYAKMPREDVENKATLAYTAVGEPFDKFGMHFDAKPGDLEFASKFWKLSEKLLAEGKIKVHPPKVVDGGLSTVLDSLKQLKEGKVSGVKLVHVL